MTLFRRRRLNLLDGISKPGPLPKKSCSPCDVRRQIYVSIPNQLMAFGKAARGCQKKGSANCCKKCTARADKKRVAIEKGIKRLHKGVEFIINDKLPRLIKRNTAHSRKLIKNNKKIVATACVFIKYVESAINKIAKAANLKRSSFKGCSGAFDHILSKDPAGYSPEHGPTPEFFGKWMHNRKNPSLVKKLNYYLPNIIRERS